MIYLNKNKSIQIQKNRRCFTNEKLDYTCIEIFDSDGIEEFFLIDKLVFTGKKFLLKDEIFILQYPDGGDLSFSPGKILLVKDKILHHSASTENGSSGSPIIRRYTKDIIGLHFGGQKSNKIKNDNEDIFIYNLGIPFDAIINDIKLQLEPKRNFILATIKIDKNNLNSRIINSYENSKKGSASSNMLLFAAKKSGINNEEKYKNVIFI